MAGTDPEAGGRGHGTAAQGEAGSPCDGEERAWVRIPARITNRRRGVISGPGTPVSSGLTGWGGGAGTPVRPQETSRGARGARGWPSACCPASSSPVRGSEEKQTRPSGSPLPPLQPRRVPHPAARVTNPVACPGGEFSGRCWGFRHKCKADSSTSRNPKMINN